MGSTEKSNNIADEENADENVKKISEVSYGRE